MANDIYKHNGLLAEFMGGRRELILTSTPIYYFPIVCQILQRKLNYHCKWESLYKVIRKCAEKINKEGVSSQLLVIYKDINANVSKRDIILAYMSTVKFVQEYYKMKAKEVCVGCSPRYGISTSRYLREQLIIK